MAVEVGSEFAKEQKVWVKRAMKGRALYFGVQAKAAKSGKFLLSKKPGDVKPNNLKELKIYEGKDADKQNTIPGGASMGVAKGENGILTLYFERGKALPVAEKFVKHFVTRDLKCKAVKKVVIAETDQLPAVPDSSDEDNFKATPESVRERVASLAGRMKALSGNLNHLEGRLKTARDGAGGNASASDDALDEVDFLLSAYERLASLEKLLSDTENQPGVAAEIVQSIRTKRLQVARQQLDSGQADEADENLDVAEQSIANLRSASGPAPQSGVSGEKTDVPLAEVQQIHPDEARWAKRRDAIEERYLQVLREQPANATQIRSVLAYADQKAEARDFGKAMQGLDSLEKLFQSAMKNTGEAVSTIVQPELLTRLIKQNSAIGEVPRPKTAPKLAITDNLVTDIALMEPPERMSDVPNFIAQFVPKFLMATVSELSQESGALPKGSVVRPQDQMLGVADLYGAVQLSLQAWETFLDRAEDVQTQLDKLSVGTDETDEATQRKYLTLLEEYNLARANGLAEEKRTLKMVNELLTEFKALQKTGQNT